MKQFHFKHHEYFECLIQIKFDTAAQNTNTSRWFDISTVMTKKSCTIFSTISSCKCFVLIYCINFITFFNFINMSIYLFLYATYSSVIILRRFATSITNIFFSVASMLFKFFTIILSNITAKLNMISKLKLILRTFV